MIIIYAELRKKISFHNIRTENKFPAIFYCREKYSFSIKLDHNYIKNIEIKKNFYNKYIIIVFDGKKNKGKVQSIQRHPFQSKINHMDFLIVS